VTFFIYRLLRDGQNYPAGKIGLTTDLDNRMRHAIAVKKSERVEGVDFEVLCVLENVTKAEALDAEHFYQTVFNVVDKGPRNRQGAANPMFGKKHPNASEVLRKAQAEWNRARRWFNNGTENRFCVPGQEPEGWVRGRLMKRNEKGQIV